MLTNYQLPDHRGSPDVEIWAVKMDGNMKVARQVGRETSTAKARKYVRENLGELVAMLKSNGWVTEGDAPQITFEFINPKKAAVTCISLSDHPLNKPTKDEPLNVVYYQPDTFVSLKDPRRYRAEACGRAHYLVHSPSGAFTIDLEQNNGKGACTCDDFSMRRSPQRSTADKRMIDGQLHVKHEDCPHLKHVKFILGLPFGEKTWLPLAKLGDAGHDPKPE